MSNGLRFFSTGFREQGAGGLVFVRCGRGARGLCLLLKQSSRSLWEAAPSVTRNADVPCAQAKLGDSIAFILHREVSTAQ
jgi:hypothetical protein